MEKIMDSLNISCVSGIKRKIEIHFVEEKKSITSLSGDSLDEIVSYLDFKSLLNFEYVSKTCKELKNFESIKFWKVLKLKDNLNFSWLMCQKETNPPKWEYRLSRGLCQYIFIDKYPQIKKPVFFKGSRTITDTLAGFELADKILLKYKDLINHFPVLHGYVRVDLDRFSNIKPYNQPVSEKVLIEFNKMCLEGLSGEKFLRGLMASREEDYLNLDKMKLIEDLFTDSITYGACYASLYAVTFPPLPLTVPITERLAIKAAEHKDERALIKLFESDLYHYLPGKLFKMGYRFHSVCKRLGDISLNVSDFIHAENFYSLALKADHVEDKFLLEKAGFVKYKLNKYLEADVLYTIALNLFGQNVLPCILVKAAEVKFYLKQYSEADVLFTKALELFDASRSPNVLALAALVKKQLKQYSEADVLFTKALELFDGCAQVLANAAQVKMHLKQYLEADVLFTRTFFKCSVERAPAFVLANAAQVKMQLKHYQDADVLFTKALERFGNNPPPELLQKIAQIKLLLKDAV